MYAVWLENNELSFCEDIHSPEPSANEALMRVILAGICGTDLIEDRYALKDTIKAYRRATQPGALKVLLKP